MRVFRRFVNIFTFILLFSACGNNESLNIHNHSNVNEVISFLESNITRYEGLNSLKGISSMKLTDDQMKYYRERIKYLVSLLRNDQLGIMRYKEIEKNYYNKFNLVNKNYFYWSRAILDEEVVNDLLCKFGENCIETKIFYEFMKDRTLNN
ncbi:hypothetical protein WKV44_10560 [Spirochaetia bacterium 38H-sp]|uniref:Lipoprotein n=1 Tax=Rarispira pelagica TaxID=3141764 RepID=A0ABU9UFM0_9SPIR